MGEQRYDDYRIAFNPRGDGTYDMVATRADGTTTTGTFEMPFRDDELERSVLWIADTATRSTATREVGPADEPVLDAEHLGSALNDALLAGDIGAGYDAARASAAAQGRGLRLTLSLGDAPALLSVPWELLYRPPRFLASQRRTPLVRHLSVPDFPAPPAIDGAVHVLGIVSSPGGLTALDVAAERSRVEAAVAPMVGAGRVDLDWLEPATRRGLREALRDGSYHIVHYVGHSDFTDDGDGVLFLETDEGTPAALDNTELANLLADQSSLRLVVLNSCEGARTSLTDPFAGVATTLVQLGVPAVVAMQFSISDTAAILFAEELYTNLIGRQAPIDAAVSEARKAIYIEQESVEWATPVLFLGSTDVDLFAFAVTAALPPPPVADDTMPAPPAASPPPPAASPRDAEPGRSRRGPVVGIAAAVAAIVAIGAFAMLRRDDGGEPALDAAGDTTQPGTATTEAPAVAATAGDSSSTTPPTISGDTSTTGVMTSPPTASTEVFNGELTAAEPTATYTFDASARSVIDLSSQIDACTGQTYTLHSPSDQRVRTVLNCSDLGRTDLVESGTYSVVIDGNGSPGAYEIVLTRVPPDVIEPVSPDGRIDGELTTVGERRIYTFDANARDSIGVQSGTDQCGRMTWTLVDPSANTVALALICSGRPRIDLASSGTFQLVVDSNGAVGAYDLTLVRVPVDVVEDLPPDGAMTGEITTLGARHTYLFTANAGDVVELAAGDGACGSLMYSLTDANENTLTSGFVCSAGREVTLQQSGRHAVHIDAVTGVGVYDLTLNDRP